MIKYLYVGIAAIVLALCGYIQWQRIALSKQEALLTQQVQIIHSYEAKIKRDAVVAKSRAAKAKAAAAENKEATYAKEQAQISAPDWTAQPLPAGVAEWLLHD